MGALPSSPNAMTVYIDSSLDPGNVVKMKLYSQVITYLTNCTFNELITFQSTALLVRGASGTPAHIPVVVAPTKGHDLQMGKLQMEV